MQIIKYFGRLGVFSSFAWIYELAFHRSHWMALTIKICAIAHRAIPWDLNPGEKEGKEERLVKKI